MVKQAISDLAWMLDLTDESFDRLLSENEFTEATTTVWHDLRTELIAPENKSNTWGSSLIWIYYFEISMEHVGSFHKLQWTI